jgi:hypothetical protein
VKTKPAAGAKKPAVSKKQTLRGKGLKKKKEHLKFGIDCTNIAEDNIMDVADFVSIHLLAKIPHRKSNFPRIFRRNSCENASR